MLYALAERVREADDWGEVIAPYGDPLAARPAASGLVALGPPHVCDAAGLVRDVAERVGGRWVVWQAHIDPDQCSRSLDQQRRVAAAVNAAEGRRAWCVVTCSPPLPPPIRPRAER